MPRNKIDCPCGSGKKKNKCCFKQGVKNESTKPKIRHIDISSELMSLDDPKARLICMEMGMSESEFKEIYATGFMLNPVTKSFFQPTLEVEGLEGFFTN